MDAPNITAKQIKKQQPANKKKEDPTPQTPLNTTPTHNFTGENTTTNPETNLFPGNWNEDEYRDLLKVYDLAFKQNWNPLQIDYASLDRRNLESEQKIGQAYWLSKLALFERSGIGAFGHAIVEAAEHQLEDPVAYMFSSVTQDECRHNSVCKNCINQLCPGFPWRFKASSELEEHAVRNVRALYDNAHRYWAAYKRAFVKYPIGKIFASFFFAEVGAQTIFRMVSERSAKDLPAYSESFKNITYDETRHLEFTVALLRQLAKEMSAEDKLGLTRQMVHGYIYLSPILADRPYKDFWELPDDYYEWDRKLEEKAFTGGLGLPTPEEKLEGWAKGIHKILPRLEELGVPIPDIPPLKLKGVHIDVGKDEPIATSF